MIIFTINIKRDLNSTEFEKLSKLITEDKRTKIQKYRSYSDAQRSLLGDVLVRYSICQNNSLLNKNLRFDKNEYGKPFLPEYPNIHHNISHAGNYVVCAISNTSPVGIDVEAIKTADMKIAERFFTNDEFYYIKEQPYNLQNICFYKIWTMKESYIKMIGKGLLIPLDSFSVLDEISTHGAYFHEFIQTSEIIGHICLAKEESVNCIKIDYMELLEFANKYL